MVKAASPAGPFILHGCEQPSKNSCFWRFSTQYKQSSIGEYQYTFFWEVLYIEEELHFLNAVTVNEKERNDADITAIETKYQIP